MPPGFKRSRALWDETKHGGIRAWVNAICYELQPIRLSKFSHEEFLVTLLSLVRKISPLILAIPSVCKSILIFIWHRSMRNWMVVGAIFVYYWFVRLIHEALDAGPLVMIFTALTLILTIGLSDDENRSGLSAYSVFNRGFEQLLGSVDADSLLAQHVGGGMMMNVNQHNDAPDHQDRQNAELPNRPRHNDEDNGRAVVNEDDVNADNVRHNDNDHNGNDNNMNRARKSGKKTRRRNLEQRQELRRQREAAIQMDFDGGQGGADDAVEIQRAIEEQIALENNR